MEIYLIRHTSVDVPTGVCYGQTDVPLKASFEQEASAVADQLESIHFDRVFTSPLSRCVRLAAHCGWMEACRDPRLLELDFGAWEMKRWEEINDPHLQEWFDDYLHVPTTGGESFMQQYARVSDFLDEVKASQARRIAIFTHGGVITCTQVYAGLKTPEEAFSSIPAYGSITRITL
ncbi:alpha-ribazole phosphatase [Bacteroides sp.]